MTDAHVVPAVVRRGFHPLPVIALVVSVQTPTTPGPDRHDHPPRSATRAQACLVRTCVPIHRLADGPTAAATTVVTAEFPAAAGREGGSRPFP